MKELKRLYVAVRAVNLKEHIHKVAEIEWSKSHPLSVAIIITNIEKGSDTASKFRKIRESIPQEF